MYTFKEIIYHYPSIKNQPYKNYSFWLKLLRQMYINCT